MDADELPPILDGPVAVDTRPPVSRWRWWIHLLALGAFPATVGIEGIVLSHRTGRHTTALLPGTIPGLLEVSVEQIGFFAIFFGIAWLASRVNRQQLLMNWRGTVMPVVWGLAYSIGLRLLIMVVGVTAVIFWMLLKTIFAQGNPQPLSPQQLRPGIEQLVNVDALTASPVYFALMLTVVSFVVAGLREELWRAGMLGGIKALFPRQMSKLPGQVAAVLVVAVLFGLAHTTQGWIGVMVTTLLGAGLGAIMVWHRSLWEAVLAHGFFDATTFVFLYLAGKYFPHQLPGF